MTEEQGFRDNDNFRLSTTLGEIRLSTTLCEKEREIEDLNDNVDQLKTELQKRQTSIKEIKTELQKKEEVFHKKLSEERESRQDESRRLCAKEREVRQLSNDVTLAVAESRKLQCTIDSMRLMAEPTRAEISDLREWKQQKLGLIEQQRNELKTMKGEMLNLNCQCKEMQETITSRDKELQERKEAFERKLVEERGSKQDENRRLRNALCVKEREVNQLNADIKMAVADAKKHLRTIDSMRLIAESTSAEISSLKSWKQQTSDVMEELINELEGMKSEISGLTCSCEERQEKIIALEKQMQEKEEIFNKKLIEERGSGRDENRRLRTALSEKESEINQLNADAKEAITNTKKLQATIDSMSLLNEPILAENLGLKEAIKDSASEKKKMTKQINDLTLWKEDALLRMKRSGQERVASDALSQMIVELENKLERYRKKIQESTKALAVMEETLMTVETHRENERTKYQESTKALALMEEALMTVETHRKMLVQKKLCTDREMDI